MSRSFLLVLVLPSVAFAQGTADDYKRAMSLREKYANAVTNLVVTPNWYGGNRLWFREELPDGRSRFVTVDAEKGEKGPAFDHKQLAEALAKAAERKVDAEKLPFRAITLDGTTVGFTAFDKGWKYDTEKRTLTVGEARPPAAPQPPGGNRPRGERRAQAGPRSPDGKFTAFVKDYNVWIREGTGDARTEKALSTDGKADDGYTSFYWSPDSKKLIAMRQKKGGDRVVTYVESSPKDQLQPKTKTVPYLKPGDPIPQPKPHLFDLATRKEIPVADTLFPNPWDISYEHWTPDSKRFLFLYNQRGHTVMRIVSVDAETGKATAIVNEECKTFFDYSSKLYLQYLDGTNELVWMSERNGWNHLYLIDARDGTVKNAITKGEWAVRGVEERVNAEKREVMIRAVGVKPDEDPYHVHYARVNLDGTGFKVLTEGDGIHGIQWSPNRKFFIDTYSRVDLPPVHVLRSADGAKVVELATADASDLKKKGYQSIERFTAKGRDGKTDIYGVIVRPSNFDPKKTYPVIENIYAGPQDHFVPKRFQNYYRHQQMADLGFIVVQCDGMGTNWRSKAFHDVCWKNLGDAGFPDRIAWIRAAAAKHAEMDIRKGVGIFGGSAGGQNALGGMLAYPDFYVVGVADCGCHDNRMDKIWWNELWMSWPIGPHYAAQSNTTNAHKLKGKLMLVVGEVDTNVDPASTLQVVNALEKADKDFDLLYMTGANHGAAESPYGQRRRMDFFVRHLLGVEPRSK
ncbi:DPP IV N-terminal domain-containing protein [Limnoglobus roseus]|nr:DPP IV N-terminal domain-containing protein [Limnoglobus roseus]